MEQLLLKACQNGQKGVVIAFLKKDGINVDAVDGEGLSPLHFACRKGYKDIVKLLLEKGANVNALSNTSVTPLHFAAASGNKEVIKLAVDGGADVSATDKEGKNPLMYAIEAKKAEAAKYLIELGADAAAADNSGRTALDYANAFGLVQLIGAISADGAGTTDAYGNTPLHQACHNGQSEVVKAMLKSGKCDIDARNDAMFTPLCTAADEDNLLIAELLLDAGADANIGGAHGYTPLHFAADNGNERLVKKLIACGAKLD